MSPYGRHILFYLCPCVRPCVRPSVRLSVRGDFSETTRSISLKICMKVRNVPLMMPIYFFSHYSQKYIFGNFFAGLHFFRDISETTWPISFKIGMHVKDVFQFTPMNFCAVPTKIVFLANFFSMLLFFWPCFQCIFRILGA